MCRFPPAGPKAGTPHLALTRRAPRRLRRRTRRERSHPVRLSRRRSTVRLRATDPWGYPSHPGPSGRQDRRDRPNRAGPHAEAPRAFCPPTPRVTHSGPCLPQAASPQRLRRERFAPAASPRRFALGRPVPIGTIVTCVWGTRRRQSIPRIEQ